MATLNSDITTSWGKNEKTGALVQEILKNLFDEIITDLDSSVTDVEIKEGSIAGQVKYRVLKGDGTYSDYKEFSLVLPSDYTVYLDTFELPEYVAPGEDASVTYSFRILDSDKVAVAQTAIIRLTISNGSYSATKEYYTLSSYSTDRARTGTLTIDSSYIKEGINKVSIEMVYRASDGSESPSATLSSDIKDKLDPETQTLTLLSFSLNLATTITGISLNLIVTDPINDSFEIACSFTNGDGKVISNNSLGLTGDKVITTKIYSSSVVLKQSFAEDSITGQNLISLSGTSTNYTYPFYIQSSINFGNNIVVYSNVVKYVFVGNIINSDESILPIQELTLTQYAYKIENYTNYSGNNISKSANKTSAYQYDTFEFPIYAYIPTDKNFTFRVNNDTITTIPISAETTKLVLISGQRNEDPAVPWSYQLNEVDENGENTINVSDDSGRGVTLTITTTINTGSLVIPTNPTLKLTSNGKSGQDEIWGTETDGETSLTKFTGFDWSSNGWLQDSDGKSALVVNNNASAVINYTPCSKPIATDSSTSTVTGRAVSFRFKTGNENTEETLISCYNSNKDGFKIYPQKAVIYRGTQSIETQFSSQDSIKEVTFVWYNSSYGSSSIIYVNGTSQMVLTSGTSDANTAKITITANESTLYLYNVECYEKPLTFSEVQAIYTTHKADNINTYVKANSIFESDVTLGNNGQKVTIDSLPVGSTYLLIKAHSNGQDRFWEKINNLQATKSMSVPDDPTDQDSIFSTKDVETKSWRVLAGETYLITKVEKNATPDSHNFYANRITISGLGTSSMSYPIKNFRIYFGKKITPGITCINGDGEYAVGTDNQDGFGDCYSSDGNYTHTEKGVVYNDGEKDYYDGGYGKTTIFVSGSEVTGTDYHPTETELSTYKINDSSIPANVFCLKADYAESSGVHNTGFARLANYVMENSSNIASETECIKLPQNVINPVSGCVCRSTIDGKAIYLFFADHDGNVTYHGKYNFNNEKASAEVFGFQPYGKKLKSFMSYIEYTLNGYTDSSVIEGSTDSTNYFDDDIVKNESKTLKKLFNLTDDSYERGHMYYKAKDNNIYINPTECWEFSTNDAADIKNASILGTVNRQIGAFTFPYTIEDGVKVTGYPYSGTEKFQSLNPFTERCVSKGIDKGLAWINTEQAWEPRYPDDDYINYFYESGGTPYLLRSVYKWLHKHNVYCWSDSKKPEHAAIFAEELHKYFNVNFLIKYYVLTKLFINADQRVKNCMLAFYCDPKVTSNEDSETPTGHMRGFFIFYDNDTILGVTNTGNLSNSWNAGETHDVFQGIDENDVCYHAIWGNLEYCYNQYINNSGDDSVMALGKLIDQAYASVRGAATDDIINEYINNSLPASAQNVDLEVKYLYPKTLAPSATNWNSDSISQYQGDRKYHRAWLIGKRSKWFDAKYGAETINSYQLDFKLEAAKGYFNSSTIKLYPEFDEWRFYLQANDNGALNPTSLLNKDGEGTLSIPSTINSNVYHIKGLYGVNKIDMSGWCGTDSTNFMDTVNIASGGHNSLPYLKEFIFGHSKPDVSSMSEEEATAELAKYSFYVKNDSLQSLFSIGDNILMPNLEKLTIQNITSNTGNIFELDFSKFTKLTEINTADTYCNIILPNGISLTKLTMKSPTTLTFENKTKLTSLTLQDLNNGKLTGLTKVTVNHCSDYLYKWALNYYLKNYSDLESFTLTIGNGSEKDTLSSDTVDLLVQVAKLIKDNSLTNATISGYGYYSEITPTQTSTLYNTFGNKLIISSTSSTTFSFSYDLGTVLEEGSTLNIGVDRPSVEADTKYTIVYVSGDEDAYTMLEVDEDNSSPYLCVLKANTINDNKSRTCVIKIKTTSDGTEYTSDEITVNYLAITDVLLTPAKEIITGNTAVAISLNPNSSCTKYHLLNSGNSDLININLSTGTYSFTESDGVINGFTISPVEGTDTTITATIFGIETNLTLYYDVQVCQTSELSTKTELAWLNALMHDFVNVGGVLGNSNYIMRSDLNNITLVTTNGGHLSITIGSNTRATSSTTIETTQDLTAVSYFKTSTDFIVPYGFPFEDLKIPEGVTNVSWTSLYLNGTGNATDYGTISFPNTVSKVRVALSFNAKISNLVFDISKATKITKIYNNTEKTSATTLPEGVFSLALTGETSNICSPDHTLFTYNTKITQIGNYSSETNSAKVEPTTAMFNITSSDFGISADPIFSLGAPTNINGLYIGYIASYNMNGAPLNWSSIQAYVKGLYYTFYRGSGSAGLTDNAISFNVLETIGDCSFYSEKSDEMKITKITLGSKVTSVGLRAFNLYGGTIIGSGTSDVILNSVTNLGGYAFGYLSNSHNFTFSNSLDTIGEFAFYGNDGVNHIITLNSEKTPSNLPDSTSYPFGQNLYNTLVVPNETVRTDLSSRYGTAVNVVSSI